jgi:hypothetical protein
MNHIATGRPLSEPAKVLFLRSNKRPAFAAAIVGGIICSSKMKVWQYPSFSTEKRSKLEKLPYPDKTWEDLQVNIIDNSTDLIRKINDRFFDLTIVCDEDGQLFSCQQHEKGVGKFYERFRNWLVTVLDKTNVRLPLLQTINFSMQEIAAIMPVAAIDRSDAPFLTSASQNLLKNSSAYFKRELPFDRFFLFYHQRPSPWKERRKELLSVTEKVYGIPLGIEDSAYIALKEKRLTDQPIDVLFVCSITNTMRKKGLERLQEWAKTRSFNVVIHNSLPYEEYCRMTAKSKVTISIAGGGWDCFRHYEAAALGSIPLMNKPTIDAVWWHSMPKAIFFENTFEDFENRMDILLRDEKLRRESLSLLQCHLEEHFLHSKIAEHVVLTTLKNA